jgi:hypothetical protein
MLSTPSRQRDGNGEAALSGGFCSVALKRDERVDVLALG